MRCQRQLSRARAHRSQEAVSAMSPIANASTLYWMEDVDGNVLSIGTPRCPFSKTMAWADADMLQRTDARGRYKISAAKLLSSIAYSWQGLITGLPQIRAELRRRYDEAEAFKFACAHDDSPECDAAWAFCAAADHEDIDAMREAEAVLGGPPGYAGVSSAVKDASGDAVMSAAGDAAATSDAADCQ